ncbi:MAG: hypothetical protein VKN13_06220 [Cyanobacteriota bacterium]|nr:hypothetical protein [Cyanobacteriota bacterium]
MRGSQLEPVLLGLAGLTVAATLLKAVGLAAPAPQRAVPASLSLAGFRVERVGADAPARRGRNVSHGPLTVWRLSPKGGGPALTLSLLPVRSRDSNWKNDGLQMAAMGQLDRAFGLRDRRLIGADSPETTPVITHQLALGRGPADRAGTTTRLQSCLTPGGQAGVTGDTLGRQLGDERLSNRQAQPLRSRLLAFSGLTPNTRWECLAVQLQTEADGTSEARLLAAWSALRRVL